MLIVPNEKGTADCVLFGIGDGGNPLVTGALPSKLPAGNYRIVDNMLDPDLAALGWQMGAYRFDKYKSGKSATAKLHLSADFDTDKLHREAEAICLARDLINTPANDLGPDELESAVRGLGRTHKATVTVVKGDALLKKNFPMIHAVGRASASAPRLIDLKWGNPKNPKVTLVGKGVIFDSGGLNIKPGNSMTLMKKIWEVLPM